MELHGESRKEVYLVVSLRGTGRHKSNKRKGKNTKVDDWTIEELNGINRRDRKWFNHLEGIYGREL